MRGLALVLWFFSLALAFPRVGVHEGFTRLVFDLPSPQTAYRTEEGEGLLRRRLARTPSPGQDLEDKGPNGRWRFRVQEPLLEPSFAKYYFREHQGKAERALDPRTIEIDVARTFKAEASGRALFVALWRSLPSWP
jgi:hypothetical protein